MLTALHHGGVYERARSSEAAQGARNTAHGWLHHSDRGSQYCSGDYTAALEAAGARRSMSRKGDCWDNAVAESFFSTLKTELIHEHRWASRCQARDAVFEYIVWYNAERLHSKNGYRSPNQTERDRLTYQAAA